MLADCFGRFGDFKCLRTEKYTEMVCVLLELNMVESYTFTKRKSKNMFKTNGHDLQ